ncbi:hypothetical protein JXA12_00740 [Candidatus Woesearchaeota archaeon]|nr:hypothetical protein [Candidatus Woesearchaeota archaeon]
MTQKTSSPSRKKGAKKPVKKKAAKKKRPTKTQQRRRVKKTAPTDKTFVFVDGKQVKNVKQLADVLEEIEDHVFNHHVSEDKNDFANWLHHVFDEIDLAKKVAGCKEKKHVQLVLYKHISHKLW